MDELGEGRGGLLEQHVKLSEAGHQSVKGRSAEVSALQQLLSPLTKEVATLQSEADRVAPDDSARVGSPQHAKGGVML